MWSGHSKGLEITSQKWGQRSSLHLGKVNPLLCVVFVPGSFLFQGCTWKTSNTPSGSPIHHWCLLLLLASVLENLGPDLSFTPTERADLAQFCACFCFPWCCTSYTLDQKPPRPSRHHPFLIHSLVAWTIRCPLETQMHCSLLSMFLVCILLSLFILFYLAILWGMQDLCSLTRNWTWALCSGSSES